jgi:hypothetical protein
LGMPKVPSAFTVTFHKSVPPREPGILMQNKVFFPLYR